MSIWTYFWIVMGGFTVLATILVIAIFYIGGKADKETHEDWK